MEQVDFSLTEITSNMEFNFVLIGFLAIAVIMMMKGYKKGLVKGVISIISLTITAIVVSLLIFAVTNYAKGAFINMAAAIILISVISIVHHLLGLVFFSAKLISKLPIVSWGDKVLGIALGMIEGVVMLWIFYTAISYLDLGAIEAMAMENIKDSKLLMTLYDTNYLQVFINEIGAKIGLEKFI